MRIGPCGIDSFRYLTGQILALGSLREVDVIEQELTLEVKFRVLSNILIV